MKTLYRLLPVVLVTLVIRARRSALRLGSVGLLVALWLRNYVRYRRSGLNRTRREYERFKSVSPEAYSRHYNERVPTIEQELEIWGPYHRHRHEMRYDLVASAVEKHIRPGRRVLDVGCGSMNVADRLAHLDIDYVGIDYGDPHIRYAATKYAAFDGPMRIKLARCDAAVMPFRDSTMDIVVMTEVIEHLVRPELAVWELSRVLRPDGVLVLTTNNAAELPLSSPLTQPLAWIEKAFGARVPELISHRPWVWPEKVHADLLPEGAGDVYLPHTHHIPAETIKLLETAGLTTIEWSSFEFPPPQSRTARVLERMGPAGLRCVDLLEAVAGATPLVRRLGTHLFLVARKTHKAAAMTPPAGVWAGPFSGGDGELRRLDRARWPRAPLLG